MSDKEKVALQADLDGCRGRYRVLRETWVDLGFRYDKVQKELSRLKDRARVLAWRHGKTVAANVKLRAEVRKLKRRSKSKGA